MPSRSMIAINSINIRSLLAISFGFVFIALQSLAKEGSNTSLSRFVSTKFDPVSGSVTLTWDTQQTDRVTLESSSDLLSWTPVTGIGPNTESFTLQPDEAPHRFFRITQPTIQQDENILLIIVDDWGIDSSPIDNPTGPNLPSMPNLEALARSGIRFSNAYAQATCSPTRASILTGRYPFRHGIGSPGGVQIPRSEITLPAVFTDCSTYALASIGKWHLGGGSSGPREDGGWPTFAGSLGSGVSDYENWEKTTIDLGQAPQTTQSTRYATTENTDDAIQWIKSQQDQPWFCWVAYNAAHSPFHAPPASIAGQANPFADARGNRNRFEAMLWAVDAEIGRLLEAVDRDKTHIILIGDNGTPRGIIQPPFSREHAKGTIYDGGTHVPLVISSPRILNPNSVHNQLVHCTDLFPTILELANIDPSTSHQILDGVSLVPILNGGRIEDRPIVCEAFGRNVDRPGRAIRHGDYKLIIFDDPSTENDTPQLELYHLPSDSNELTNLLDGNLSALEQASLDNLLETNDALGGNFNR